MEGIEKNRLKKIQLKILKNRLNPTVFPKMDNHSWTEGVSFLIKQKIIMQLQQNTWANSSDSSGSSNVYYKIVAVEPFR